MTEKPDGFNLLSAFSVHYEHDRNIKPRKLKSFQEGIDLLDQIREQDTRSSREKIIPIIKGMIEFADTTKKLYALLSWAVPRQHIDRLIIEKLIKIATKEEELDYLLRETLVDVHPGLWDLWKQREKEITVNRE